jgi:stage III sporulation protein AE
MQKKNLRRWLIITICFFGSILTAWGTPLETTSESISEEILQTQLDWLNWERIETLEAYLKSDTQALADFNLKDKVMGLMSGKENFSLENILKLLGEMLFSELGTVLHIMIQFLMIAVMCSVLQTLSSSFESKEITKIAFLAAYLLIILLSVQSLFMLVQLAGQTIERLSDIMAVTLPTLLAFMAISGYITSSGALASIIIGTLNVIVWLIKTLIFPSIVAVMILQIVGTVSKDFQIDKLIKLFYKGSKWALRGILVIGLGIMGIYRITLPLIDEATYKATTKLAVRFIPIIGDATSGVIEFVSKCFMLVKSSFSIGVILWIVLLLAVPIIKISVCSGLYHILSAVLEPLGNKQMSKIAEHLGNGCGFVVGCVMLVAILSVSVLVLCMSVGSNLL